MQKFKVAINTRQRSIIYTLLELEHHTTLKALSERTHLSVRIIRYNLDVVTAWFRNEGIQLTTRPGYGIAIDASKSRRRDLMDALSSESEMRINFTRSQRQRITLFELLISTEPMSYQQLADNGHISRSTIINDMSEMEKWLHTYHLSLHRTPNRGIYLSGSELLRRFALIQLIKDEIGIKHYYSIWVDPSIPFITDKSLPQVFEEYLSILPLTSCRTAIRYIESMMEMNFALDSRVETMLFLAVSAQSYQKGQINDPAKKEEKKHPAGPSSQFSFDIQETPTQSEQQIAEFVLHELSRKLSLNIPQKERNICCICLRISKLEWNEQIDPDYEDNDGQKENINKSFEISDESILCADLIIAACSGHLHPLIQTDEQLFLSLARHFQPVIHRIRNNIPIPNDCLDTITRDYPEIFRSINTEISVIEKVIQKPVPPEEIAYIAMYMISAMNQLQTITHQKISVIIIGDGMRTKTIFLQNRLQLIFPVLEVVKLINGYPESEVELEEADMIISLIPGVIVDKPILEISPFLNMTEIRLLQSKIIEFEEEGRKLLLAPAEKPDLIDLLKPENIIIRDSATDWEEVIHYASEPLIHNRLIDQSYYEAMVDLTKQYGPYASLAPGVVLLNARPGDGVNKLCLSMLILRKPVDFLDMPDIHVAFVLGAADNQAHLNALFQLSKTFEIPEFVRALRQCRRSSDVMRTIWIYASLFTPETV